MIKQPTDNEKLATATELEGFTSYVDMCREAQIIDDGSAPAICMNDECDNMADLETDATNGWCDNCETNTMKSVLVLAGLI